MTRGPRILWPEEKVNALRTLVARRLTADQIAKALSTTKSAICGRCMRMGLKIRDGKPGKPPVLSPASRPPSVAYVRCLKNYRTAKFIMVRP